MVPRQMQMVIPAKNWCWKKYFPDGNYETELVDFYLVNVDTMQVTDEQEEYVVEIDFYAIGVERCGNEIIQKSLLKWTRDSDSNAGSFRWRSSA